MYKVSNLDNWKSNKKGGSTNINKPKAPPARIIKEEGYVTPPDSLQKDNESKKLTKASTKYISVGTEQSEAKSVFIVIGFIFILLISGCIVIFSVTHIGWKVYQWWLS